MHLNDIVISHELYTQMQHISIRKYKRKQPSFSNFIEFTSKWIDNEKLQLAIFLILIFSREDKNLSIRLSTLIINNSENSNNNNNVQILMNVNGNLINKNNNEKIFNSSNVTNGKSVALPLIINNSKNNNDNNNMSNSDDNVNSNLVNSNKYGDNRQSDNVQRWNARNLLPLPLIINNSGNDISNNEVSSGNDKVDGKIVNRNNNGNYNNYGNVNNDNPSVSPSIINNSNNNNNNNDISNGNKDVNGDVENKNNNGNNNNSVNVNSDNSEPMIVKDPRPIAHSVERINIDINDVVADIDTDWILHIHRVIFK